MLYRVIGLMSGSSLDGLDIAFVELEELGGKWSYEIVGADCIPYTEDWQKRLLAAESYSAASFMALHSEYGKLIASIVNEFIAQNELGYKVALIASHGHTVFHVPGSHSVQIGDGAAIAALTALPVVSDLRAVDVALGGQGAPIVPVGEQLLFPQYRFFLNIGGIANLSYNGGDHYDAFDVCAANRVLNMLVQPMGLEFDRDGELAARGSIHEGLLSDLNALDYYQQPYPKSLANEFGTKVVYPMILASGLSAEDALATYVEHIAIQISASIATIMERNGLTISGDTLLITGGGALNTYLVSRIRQYLAPIGIEPEVPDEVTVMYKEALVMALLGVLRWREEVTVFASVTGASRSSIGGALWMGAQ
jgi:anhydro-N-acetylmuramic acid kinase